MENKINTTKKDYIWNMIGSVCYSASSFYYMMLVTRICGVNDGGVFALAFATAQLLLTFGRYGMRTYQATDVRCNYTFLEYGTSRVLTDGGVFALAFATAQLLLTFGRYGMRTYQATDVRCNYTFLEYGTSRVLTCAGMILFAWIYSAAAGYSSYKTQIFIWVAALKMIDAVEDVYHGELQRGHQVALMGKLLAARNLFSCLVFGIVIIFSRSLRATCILTAVLSLIFAVAINHPAVSRTWVFGIVIIFSRSLRATCILTAVLSLIFAVAINHPAVSRTCGTPKKLRLGNLKRLFLICFPIFISTFLSLYLYNIPKYAIDSYLTEDIQTYYSILFYIY